MLRKISFLAIRFVQNNYAKLMTARVLGAFIGVVLGFFVGGGTGIVGGIFGAVAGAAIFMFIGGFWGLSAGPDVARLIERWRAK